jgi:DNA processing protein
LKQVISLQFFSRKNRRKLFFANTYPKRLDMNSINFSREFNLLTQPELLFWLAAIRLPGIGPRTLHHGLSVWGNIKTLFMTNEIELKNAGFKLKQIESIKNPDWGSAEKDLAWCEKNNCHIISIFDERYPILLKETHGAPAVLFVQGDLSSLNKPQLAIVGSRNPTTAGKELAEQFAQQLIHSGLLITSGFAIGIDTAAHQGALSAGGQTLAVCGTGLKTIYPASNRKLAEAIKANGALISEFLPDEPANALNFPRRNRIISGLSLGVLVVEAALRSGSLITAHYAGEQGREVFSIPGSIHNPLTRGCHQLIREGAKLVETATDIVEELGAMRAVLPTISDEKVMKSGRIPPNIGKKESSLDFLLNINDGVSSGNPSAEIAGILPIKEIVSSQKSLSLDKKTRAFLAQMSYEVTSFDTLLLRSGLTAGEVSSMLLALELQGYVQTVRGGYQLRAV